MYEIYADGKLLFATQYSNDPDYQVLAPKVEFSEIGRAGSCTFTMLPGHPLYDSLKEKKTNILVKANNNIIFKGCVSSAVKDFYNQKEVRCEGDLTYLFNSQVRPCKFTKTAEDLFRYYIDEHNNKVSEDQRFVVGTILNDDAKTEVTLDETSFQDTKSAIEGNLIDYYGGYLRTRDQNGITYIDWIKEYDRKSKQIITFGDNLLDMSQEVSPDDIFTVLIPIGQDGLTIESVNGGKDYLEVEGGIDKWRRIEKTVDFSNISEPEKLKEAGLKYISTNYDGSPLSITLTAINLAHAGANADDIFIGDKVRIVSIPHGLDKEYTCVSVSYDLYYPDKTSYTFGKKIQDLTRRYNQKARTTADAISETHSSAGRGIGGLNNKLDQYITATDDTLTLQHENIVMNAKKIEMNAEQITLRATKEEHNALGKRMSTVEIDLNGDETTIGLKAELRQTVDGLGGLDSRLSRAEIDINGAEGTIGLKTMVAENREWLQRNDGTLEILDRRVSKAEIDINGEEGTIGLKTSVSDLKKTLDETGKKVTGINSRLSKAEIDINGDEGTIGLKTSVSDLKKTLDETGKKVTGINSRLSKAEIDINGDDATIGLKASVHTIERNLDETGKKVTGIDSRLSKAEIDINGDDATIGLKASVHTIERNLDETGKRITDIDTRLSKAEINIDGDEGTIGLSTSISDIKKRLDENDKKVSGIDTRLSSAEIDINGSEGTIGLKTEINNTIRRVDENTGQLKTAFQRISSAEISIDANKSEIQLKASTDIVNGIADRVSNAEATLTVNSNEIATKVSKNGVISSINQTSESVTINASKINLNGYVTASQLEATNASFNNFLSGNAAASSIVTTNLQVNRRSLSWKTMTVVNSFTQASGEASTGDSYVLAGSAPIPGPTSYTPDPGTTITF